MLKKIFFTSSAVFFSLSLTAGVAFASHRPVETVQVQFVNHIQINLPEQDVFVEKSDDATKVIRPEGDFAKNPTTQALPVYATATTTPHDPFKVGSNPVGPYAKGISLGFTLGDWLAATGSGTYVVKGVDAEMHLTFQHLVPNDTYTVWCSRLKFPPEPRIDDFPCGAADGSQNIFKADAQGNGKFDLVLKKLPVSNKAIESVFAIAYHSDGKTYGARPGDFGYNTHVQLVAALPTPAKIAHSHIARHLSFGRRGDDVKDLQEFLIDQEFIAADLATGYFGPLTREAVKKFQKHHSLPDTGFFGPLSRQKMSEL